MITIPLSLLLAHFIGDFILQNDWMALNKSKRTDALALHVGVYSLCFFWLGAPFVAWTFVLHYLTDAVTSRITSRLWFVDGARILHPHFVNGLAQAEVVYNNKRHWFFVAIGADQLIHYVTLALTLRFLS